MSAARASFLQLRVGTRPGSDGITTGIRQERHETCREGLVASVARAAAAAGMAAAEEPRRGGTLVTVPGTKVRNLNPAGPSGIVTGYPGARASPRRCAMTRTGPRSPVSPKAARSAPTGIHPDSPFREPHASPHDLDLGEAGFAMQDGRRFSLTIGFGRVELKPDAEYVKAVLRKVGIDVTLRASADFPTSAKRMGEMDLDLSWNRVFNRGDPVIGVHRSYICSNIGKGVWSNTKGYCNPTVDEILDKAAVENDPERRSIRSSRRSSTMSCRSMSPVRCPVIQAAPSTDPSGGNA